MPIPFDLDSIKIVMVTCGEKHVSKGQAWSLSQRSGAPAPQIFGTFYIHPHTV